MKETKNIWLVMVGLYDATPQAAFDTEDAANESARNQKEKQVWFESKDYWVLKVPFHHQKET